MMSGGMAAMETWGQGSLGDPYAKRIIQWPWYVKLHIRVLPQNLTFLYNHIPQHLYLLWHLFPHHTYYIISAKPESRVFDWYSILCLAHIDLTKGATFQKLCRGIVGKRLEEEKKEAMLGGLFHLRCTVPLEPEQFVNIAFGNPPPPISLYLYSLMLNLKIQMPCYPVIEERLVHITCRLQLVSRKRNREGERKLCVELYLFHCLSNLFQLYILIFKFKYCCKMLILSPISFHCLSKGERWIFIWSTFIPQFCNIFNNYI